VLVPDEIAVESHCHVFVEGFTSIQISKKKRRKEKRKEKGKRKKYLRDASNAVVNSSRRSLYTRETYGVRRKSSSVGSKQIK
jgi:hypothetical protein